VSVRLTHLKEELVAHDTGASRTPVREALQRLNAEQLVVFEPNRSAYVTSWSLEDVEEIYTLRTVLEGQAAFQAATRIAKNKITILVECAYRIDQLLIDAHDRQSIKIFEANHRFHNTILEASHSERLSKMLSWLVEIPMTLQTFEKYSDRGFERSNHHHRELIDTFKSRDLHWAQKVMETHLSAAQRLFAFRRTE